MTATMTDTGTGTEAPAPALEERWVVLVVTGGAANPPLPVGVFHAHAEAVQVANNFEARWGFLREDGKHPQVATRVMRLHNISTAIEKLSRDLD